MWDSDFTQNFTERNIVQGDLKRVRVQYFSYRCLWKKTAKSHACGEICQILFGNWSLNNCLIVLRIIL